MVPVLHMGLSGWLNKLQVVMQHLCKCVMAIGPFARMKAKTHALFPVEG